MAKRPDVIPGEATESESEEEINQHATETTVILAKQKSSTTPHGIVVAGEAPESDDEEQDINSPTDSKLPSKSSNTNLKNPKVITKHRTELQHTSLLHRKLYERNVCLRKDISELVHNTVATSGQKLNVINQQLLRSQVQLQEAVTNLNMWHSNSVQLNTKLAGALSDSFIPEIKIPE